MAGPFDKFDDRAKRVLALAQDEAIRFNHRYIGTEHLLLALVREGQSVAARALDALGIKLSSVRSAVELKVKRGDPPAPSEITLSPGVKKVIDLAIDEARRLGHSHVGPEHLLLGLLGEGEGIAAGVLQSLGASLETVREEVMATLAGKRSADPLKSVGAITLFVEDPQRSKAFYRHVFGRSAIYEDEDAVAFRFESMIVNLLKTSAARDLIDPGVVAGPEAGSRFQLTIWVDDADAVCAELAKRGVGLLNGPMDRKWGVRTASFTDPDGHIWEIAQQLPRG
jgi:catechol 2,3-dioxygenase-like lactoylglutathione lyase family enzyme